MRRHTASAPLLALVIAVFGGGCSAKALRKGKAAVTPQTPSQQALAVESTAGEVDVQEEASLRYKDYKPIPELVTVHFDYDKSDLSDETRKALQKNAEWLKDNPGIEVQIQGHCDDRGTTEYNLALGQRRAQAVRDYYKMLGIRFKRMATISYGEEQPVCTEATEECWQRNRRAETLIHKK